MNKSLPARPNLDHLRRQAKSLLAALESGDKDAVSTIVEHLPAAKGKSAAAVRKMGIRLADAQSAIARKSGFAGWPQLARHVDQLRALEGEWSFLSLEVDGSKIPPSAVQSSRILIDGDRFRCESPEANYEGIFNIDVETQPHKIDIEFVEGPEAGNWNYGIFRITGDQLEICLDMNGKPAPKEFRTHAGSGQACEVLTRVSASRPASVTGGTPHARPAAPEPRCLDDARADFAYVPSELMTRLQGEWSAVKLVRDGQEFPPAMRGTGHRSMKDNEIRISFGGQLIIHALTRIRSDCTPIEVDYLHLSGQAKGMIQLGIMEWRGGDACFCMSMPGAARPTDFTSAAGSGRTLSQWRLKK